MIDEDEGSAQHGSGVLYDFFKWVTSLALLTIGGSLTLLQTAEIKADRLEVLIMLAPLLLTGIIGLQGASDQVRQRVAGKKPSLQPMTSVKLVMLLIGVGCGAVVAIFTGGLSQ